MKKMKLLYIGVIALLSFSAKAQLSLAYYDGNPGSKIGIGYEFNEKIWTEARLYTGSRIEDINLEAVVNFNFKQNEDYRFYLGVGFVVNNINGLVAPLGLQIMPFQNFKQFAFQIEALPMYEVDLNNVFLFGTWGIRYRFL